MTALPSCSTMPLLGITHALQGGQVVCMSQYWPFQATSHLLQTAIT